MEEFAARKRLVRSKMELHRVEMALYYHETVGPIRSVQLSMAKAIHHPATRAGLIAGITFFIFSKRFRFVRKSAGFIAPFVWPRIRNLLMHRAVQFGLNTWKVARG